MKKQLTTAAVTGALVILGGGPALAVNGPTVSTDGSSATYLDTGNDFEICDTDKDGDSVYVKFTWTGVSGYTTIEYTGGVEGGGGDGCVNRDTVIPEGKRVYYKSCQQDAFDDTCSAYTDTDS